jgi:hypothetical protein
MKVVPLEKIADNPYYKVLFDHCSALEATFKEHHDQITRLSDEVGHLKASRKEWEDNFVVRLLSMIVRIIYM